MKHAYLLATVFSLIIYIAAPARAMIGPGPTRGTGDMGGASIGQTRGAHEGQGVSIGTRAVRKASTEHLIFLWKSSYFQQGMSAYRRAKAGAGQGVVTIGKARVGFKPIDQSVLDTYQSAIGYFAQAYADPTITLDGTKPTIVIDGAVSRNYVVASIKSLMSTLLNNMQSLKNTIVKLKSLGKDYSSDMALLGTEASRYDTVVLSVQTYVQKNWDSLYQPYAATMASLLISTYTFALNDLASRPQVAITSKIVAQAQSYFKQASLVWNSDLRVTGFADAQAALTSFHTATAQVAYTAFQNQLNAMRPEESITSLGELIGSGSHNRQLLRNAQEYMKLAADAYQGLSGGEAASLAASYTGSFKSLEQAVSLLDQALNASGLAAQVGALQQAVLPLTSGGAAWFAQHIGRGSALLLADYYVQQGQAVFAKFVATYRSRVAEINSVIQTTDVTHHNFQDFFKALSDACQEASHSYNGANTYYQLASQTATTFFSNGSLLTTQQTQHINNRLTLLGVQSIVAICQKAGLSLGQAFNVMGSGADVSRIGQAQSLIAGAITLLGQSDAAYQKLATAAGVADTLSLVPFYNLIPSRSLTSFVAQYTAHFYRMLASRASAGEGVQSKALIADYYVAAFSYQQYLSPVVQQDILSSLKRFTSIVDSAQKALDTARRFDANASASKQPASSSLRNAWEAATSATLAVYTIWNLTNKSAIFKAGPSLYSGCLQAYLQSYAIEQQPDSSMMQLLLQYRLYLLSTVGGVAVPGASTLPARMRTLLEQIFAQARTFMQDSSNQQVDEKNGYAAALTGLNSLRAWQESIDALVSGVVTALSDQKNAVPGSTLQALIKNDRSTYSSPLFADVPAIVISNISLQLAQLYNKQGDWAIGQAIAQAATAQVPIQATECTLSTGFHGIAADAYGHARIEYTNLGNSLLAQQMAILGAAEGALANADLVGDAPKVTLADTHTFGSFLGTTLPVYGQYFLSPWIVQIPPTPPLVPALLFSDYALYTKDKSNQVVRGRVESDLRTLAATAYLYQHLASAGLLSAFTYDYLSAVEDTQANGGVTDATLLPYVKSAQRYRERLVSLMNEGLTVGEQMAVKTTLTFLAPAGRLPALVYCNIPVVPVPLGQGAAQATDPTAVLAYAYALQQYQGFKSATSSQRNYVNQRIAVLQQRVQQSYLSEAYALYQKVAYMQGVAVPGLNLFVVDDQERANLDAQKAVLGRIGKSPGLIKSLDIGDQAKALVNAIKWAQDYYSIGATYVDTAVTPGAVTGSGLSSAQGLLGYFYEKQADFVKSYLLGDPTALQYQAYVNMCSNLYITAEGTYQQANLGSLVMQVKAKRAQLFETVGHAYVAKRYYISSLQYLNTAQQLYKAVATGYQQANARQALVYEREGVRLGLESLVALFQGAVELFLSWYQARWSSAITLPSGTTVSFAQLTADCGSTFGYTQEESQECSRLQNSLLDSLIYFTSVDSTIAQQAQSGGLTLATPTSNLAQSDAQEASGASSGGQVNPAIQAYLNRSLPLGADNKPQGLAAVLVGGTLSVDVLRVVFNGLILGGNKLDEFTDLSQASVKTGLAQVLGLTKDWADYIFQAISASYIANYLSSVCAGGITSECIENQYGDLIDAMKAEEQNILAPAQEYVG